MNESNHPEGWPTSALKAADKTFTWLATGPKPLTLDCAALTGADVAAAATHGAGYLGIAAVTAGHSGSHESAGPSALPKCRTAAGSAELPRGGADGGRGGGTTDETAGSAELPAVSMCRTAGRRCRNCRTAGFAEGAELRRAGAARDGSYAGEAGTSAPSGNCLDLPSSEVPLPALRDWLIAHPNASAIRDAVWRELIRRAREGRPEWVIAAVGMAMPTLAAMASTLATGDRADPADIDSKVLTGFLEALRHGVDINRGAPFARLCSAAWRAGRARAWSSGTSTWPMTTSWAPAPQHGRVGAGADDGRPRSGCRSSRLPGLSDSWI